MKNIFKWPFAKRDATPAPGLPSRGHKRALLNQLFKAAATTAQDRWTSIPISIDQFITLNQTILVARSREQWSNNDYVRSFIRRVRQNVIGPKGVALQVKAKNGSGKIDKAASQAVEDDFTDWGKVGTCDVTGKLSWRDSQCLAIETCARDGEFIIRKVYGDDAGPHGFAIQFIDPQRLPVNYENYKMDENGGFVRQGIEFNRYGRPIAYHFTSTDEYDSYYYTINGRGFIRIPANEIIHRFVTEVVGQRRGLPWASTSLFRLHHMQGFEDAAVQNARAGATQMGFITYAEGFGPEVDDDCDVSAIDAEPLSFHELPQGADFKEFKPQYPNGEFATFSKSMLRGAAAGMGVAYNGLAGDLEGVNFSSIRQGTLDEREHWKDLQEWVVESLHCSVYEAWLAWRVLNGKIIGRGGKPLSPADLSRYKCVEWQPRRWQWVDPRADVDAAVESIRSFQTTFSQVIRDQGRDPDVVFAEFADDIANMTKAGIPNEIIVAFLLGAPPAPEPATADDAPANKGKSNE